MNSFYCAMLLSCLKTAVMLSPHCPHSTSLLFASEWAQELEEKGVQKSGKKDGVSKMGSLNNWMEK